MNNFNEFLNEAVSVYRFVEGGQSASGAISKSTKQLLYDNLKCSLQGTGSDLFMSSAGQTVLDTKIMYCDICDLKVKDEVHDAYGNVYKVTSVIDYKIAVPHMKVKLLGGVTNG